jgi:uncharacterized membrane protein
MARLPRIFSPTFVTSLVVFVGSMAGVALTRDTVLSCSVGFSNAVNPLSVSQAARCLNYEVASAVLVAVGLVTAAVLIWLGAKFFRAMGPDLREAGGSDRGKGANSLSGIDRAISWFITWPAYRWVAFLITLFFVASFFAASWEYVNFHAGNWDLSINQQALSSTILGSKPHPFYEAFNCGRHGQCSFLLVHPVFLAYGVAAVYAIAPTAFTLFSLQSLAVGLGALPLYVLATDVIGSRRLSLLVPAAYLAWVPLFLGMFSFHWEALIPVEIFTLFLLWHRQRYLLAIPVILLAFITLEVTPVLIFFVGAFFLWPSIVEAIRLFYHAFRSPWIGSSDNPSKFRLWWRWIWKTIRVRQVYASIALMAGSLVGYVLLRLFVTHGGWPLGLPPVPPAYALPLSSPNKVFAFTFAALRGSWQQKLVFWIVIYVTLGFIPLFAPRTLLLVLPWFVFTAFSIAPTFWRFGDQYPFIPAAALFIGFTFGLAQLFRWMSGTTPQEDREPAPSDTSQSSISDEGRSSPVVAHGRWALPNAGGASSSDAVRILSLSVVIIVGGNLLLNPLNPVAASIIPQLGLPFVSTYQVSVGPVPDNQALQQLVSIIPQSAVVTAPLPVFTWVADDPYAYPMIPGINVSQLPGVSSGLPEFVLLPFDAPSIYWNTTLLGDLYNPSNFGVRGCVGESAIGGVELFQRHYTGAPEIFGPVFPLCPNYFSGRTGLTATSLGTVMDNDSAPSGVVVRSTPCDGRGNFSSGPGLNLTPGKYKVQVVFNAMNYSYLPCGSDRFPASQTVLDLNVTGGAGTGMEPVKLAHHIVTVAGLCSPCGKWYYWNATLTVPPLTTDLSVTAAIIVQQYVVQIAYVLLSPESR